MIKPLETNPTFVNPLSASSSPYLRQHMNNPVYWYPWGREAFERAREENKPILLSVGYSTCYWCHVMEREVFDNVSIAAQMNEFFINVKVDREEMPEIDEIYMIARTLMTQQGGWPNNVFLTPELKPFYALGTAPAMDSGNRQSFPRVLEWMNYVWQTQRDDVQRIAGDLVSAMESVLRKQGSDLEKPMSLLEQAHKLYDYLAGMHDDRSGGFFQAPKFPHETNLLFLMEYYRHTAYEPALKIAHFTLEKMSAGGIHDHVGCGFHRYAVDKEWFVPHFEKMLYNQALITRSMLECFSYSKEPLFADMARATLEFCSGPFTHPQGAFYAAFDAEVQGIEGAYHAWEAAEIQSVLDEAEANFFTRFFALAQIPHFPGHPKPTGQVIIARQPLHIAAREAGMPYVQLMAMVGLVMNKLLAVRNQREGPRRDDKIITSWNGLMIHACALAGQTLSEPRYTEMAVKAARFILQNSTDLNGNLRRIWINGKAEQKARLEDYACLLQGILALLRSTGEAEWKNAALDLMRSADRFLRDEESDGWFMAEADDHLIVRPKTADDTALPSANGVMLHNLIDLYEITGEAAYLERARAIADSFSRMTHRLLAESACMCTAFLRLEAIAAGNNITVPEGKRAAPLGKGEHKVSMSVRMVPSVPFAGSECELVIGLNIAPGWYIQPYNGKEPALAPTQIEINGPGVAEVREIKFQKTENNRLEGTVTVVAKIVVSQQFIVGANSIRVMLQYQPCSEGLCMGVASIAGYI